MQMGRQYHQSEIITSSHQTNGNVSFHTGVEFYLGFKIQLNLDLQAAVLLAHLGGPVLDARLAHGHDASAACGVLRDGRLFVVLLGERALQLLLLLAWVGDRTCGLLHGAFRYGLPELLGGFAASGGTRCGRCVWGRELFGLI